MLDVFCITMALMVGTAGLPHVIIRFYTVPRVRDARSSAGWALLFIAILYTTAPAVAAFARTNLLDSTREAWYDPSRAGPEEKTIPDWFRSWEDTDLIAWLDKNGDGRVQYRAGAPFTSARGKKPIYLGAADDPQARGPHGERLLLLGENGVTPTESKNELYIDRDIIVLANPEIAGLPAWVIGLVAAGGLAAALSTAAGLLLVVSTAISHDLLKRAIVPKTTEKQELRAARIAAAVAVCCAG